MKGTPVRNNRQMLKFIITMDRRCPIVPATLTELSIKSDHDQ